MTRNQLKQIIKEEYKKVLKEGSGNKELDKVFKYESEHGFIIEKTVNSAIAKGCSYEGVKALLDHLKK